MKGFAVILLSCFRKIFRIVICLGNIYGQFNKWMFMFHIVRGRFFALPNGRLYIPVIEATEQKPTFTQLV